MIKVSKYDISGKELESVTLNEKVFGVKVNENLIHQSVVTQLANARWNISDSKTRAQVAGSGKKPWRQKGTGRARVGSVRNPVWVGGGAAFGPKNAQNFSKKFPKKMKRQALLQALSSKVQDKCVIIINKINFKDFKTKLAVKFLRSLPISKGTILIIMAKTNLVVESSFRNLPYVKTILANNLNVVDTLKYKWLLISEDALSEIDIRFSKTNNEKDIINKAPQSTTDTKKTSKKITQKAIKKPAKD